MSATSDPLLLLRQALSTGATIKLIDASGKEVYSIPEATSLSFAPYSDATLYPKTTPTRYLSATAGPAAAAAGPPPTYDLQTLLFAYLQQNATLPDYMKQAREAKMGFVSTVERRGVLEYLSGKGSAEGPEGKVLPIGGAGATGAADGSAVLLKRDGDAAGTEGGKDAGPSTTAGDGSAPPAAKKPKYMVNLQDQEKVKRMMETIQGPVWGVDVAPGEKSALALEKVGAGTKNRITVLAGQRVNNFESVRALVAPRIKLTREQEGVTTGKDAAAAAASATTTAGGQPTKQRRKALNPIIIISPSSTALISMHNVRKLLEESVFVHPDEARAANRGVAEDMVQVSHARTTSSIQVSLQGGQGQGAGAEHRKARYFVVDGVEALAKFGPDAWDRVVCVMTTGQEWQFRPYKWTEPKELFHHVKGVFVQWTTDAANEKVRKWNVTELRIDPTKRHIDKSTVAGFWRDLEAWIGVHKPGLTY